ncbi:lipo-like protein [Colwellia sp. BRX10-3]|uniref:YiiX/YebB-like N1pC/P60 family cysteine hydrolase n=1 Tax=Colwellia sp. BRX10-3 TaxID=2759844 RepID=UPI0015F7629A|nr:YiiX/YebB-like N1pC/P60 family cysteine hydrolase [Colwellia sp. BRX10-3]MBA6392184.1 lipo-like protein [Colwellia sp. BRX10-3]
MSLKNKEQKQSIISRIGNALGDKLATFLNKPRAYYTTFSTLTSEQLKESLMPGDLLLIEGNSRISTAIKYLTQSTWSHVCIYIGDKSNLSPLLEADLVDGVITVPLEKYAGFNMRICRPVGLTDEDTEALLDFVTSRIGLQYDTKNIIDLMRYLLPTPPVPQNFRRRLLEFGSGDPTKAICSTLIAQAFQFIRYPILPLKIPENISAETIVVPARGLSRLKPRLFARNRLEKRHYSHFIPRDFDLSPYFEIVKPTLKKGFNYKDIQWVDQTSDITRQPHSK